MMSFFNRTVETPIGQGVAQSALILVGGVAKYLVRLPINDETRPHLRDVNCITPRAQMSGLWCFKEEELSAVGASSPPRSAQREEEREVSHVTAD